MFSESADLWGWARHPERRIHLHLDIWFSLAQTPKEGTDTSALHVATIGEAVAAPPAVLTVQFVATVPHS